MRTRIIVALSLAVCCLALFASKPALSQTEAENPAASASGKAYLGLQLGEVPKLLAMHLPELLGEGQGLMVLGVDADSPALAAGIETDDILVEFAGKKTADFEQLVEQLQAMKPDQKVELTVIRRGQPLQVKVTLGERPLNLSAGTPLDRWPSLPNLGTVPDLRSMQDLDDLPALRDSMEQMNRMMERMNRQFDKQFGEALRTMPKLGPDAFSSSSQSSSSSDFVSISLNQIDGDRYRLVVKYKTPDGEVRELTSEGTLEELRKAAESDEKMPAKVRKQVFGSLQAGTGKLQSGDWSAGNLSELKERLKQFRDRNFNSNPSKPLAEPGDRL